MLRIRSRVTRLLFAGPARRQHARTLRTLRKSGASPQSILFLCYGNICRSPVAEKVFQQLRPNARVTSAGFYPDENRPSPLNVQKAAKTIGVDLTAWSSRRVSRKMVDQSDLIVLFDLKNFLRFREAFPHAVHKLALLGLFLHDDHLEIDDPYGKPERETLEIVKLIRDAAQSLADQLK